MCKKSQWDKNQGDNKKTTFPVPLACLKKCLPLGAASRGAGSPIDIIICTINQKIYSACGYRTTHGLALQSIETEPVNCFITTIAGHRRYPLKLLYTKISRV